MKNDIHLTRRIILIFNFFPKEIWRLVEQRAHSSFIIIFDFDLLLFFAFLFFFSLSFQVLANGKNWPRPLPFWPETRRPNRIDGRVNFSRAIFPRCGTSLALSVDIHAQCPGFFVFRQQWLATVTSCVAIAQSARLHHDNKGVKGVVRYRLVDRGSLRCSCIGMRRQTVLLNLRNSTRIDRWSHFARRSFLIRSRRVCNPLSLRWLEFLVCFLYYFFLFFFLINNVIGVLFNVDGKLVHVITFYHSREIWTKILHTLIILRSSDIAVS